MSKCNADFFLYCFMHFKILAALPSQRMILLVKSLLNSSGSTSEYLRKLFFFLPQTFLYKIYFLIKPFPSKFGLLVSRDYRTSKCKTSARTVLSDTRHPCSDDSLSSFKVPGMAGFFSMHIFSIIVITCNLFKL